MHVGGGTEVKSRQKRKEEAGKKYLLKEGTGVGEGTEVKRRYTRQEDK